MANHDVYLKLDGNVLKWSPDGSSNWTPVTSNEPSTGVNLNDTVSWHGDDTISKIKIKPPQSKILKSVSNDDSKSPQGNVDDSIDSPVTEKYVISIKSAKGNGYTDYDPDLRYPA